MGEVALKIGLPHNSHARSKTEILVTSFVLNLILPRRGKDDAVKVRGRIQGHLAHKKLQPPLGSP